MRARSPSLLLLGLLGCVDEPTDVWSAETEASGLLNLSGDGAAELSLNLILQGDLADDAYIDTGGDEVTVHPEAQAFALDWRLELTPGDAGHGPLRVLFYSDTDPLVHPVTDLAADGSGGSAVVFDAPEVECVFEPATWNVCTRHMRVRVERRDDTATSFAWRVAASAVGEDGTASVVEDARLGLEAP